MITSSGYMTSFHEFITATTDGLDENKVQGDKPEQSTALLDRRNPHGGIGDGDGLSGVHYAVYRNQQAPYRIQA